METACREAENNNCIVVIGISPSYPTTGYGYIKVGISQPEANDNVFPVLQFLENPSIERAQEIRGVVELLRQRGYEKYI